MSTDEPPGYDVATWSAIDSTEWYTARDATTALRDVLKTAGMERAFPYLRADVNAFGHAYVELGRVAPETAQRIAELLALGLAAIQPIDVKGKQP